MERLTQMEGVENLFKGSFFHEFVLHFKNNPASHLLERINDQFHIQAGYDLTHEYPELGQCILVCTTETKTEEDLLAYQNSLQAILNRYTKEEIYST
jgi:glycine dehydrogenase subunit 1